MAPGARLPYKPGAALLYRDRAATCVPVATNAGLFWPRRALIRRPGRAVIEFLPAIPPGLDKGAFLDRLEHTVETASNRLMAEAGFHAQD